MAVLHVVTFTITVKKVSARDLQTWQSAWLPRGEQLLQSHFQCTLPGMCGRGAGVKRLTQVQDIEISVQGRPATLHSQAHRTATYPVAFAFSFLVSFCCCCCLFFWFLGVFFVVLGFYSCFCCCFLVFEFYLTKLQVLLAWPCQHHRLGASLPSWIRSKAWSSRNLHQQGLH